MFRVQALALPALQALEEARRAPSRPAPITSDRAGEGACALDQSPTVRCSTSSAGFARATRLGGGSEGAVEAPFDALMRLERAPLLPLTAAFAAGVATASWPVPEPFALLEAAAAALVAAAAAHCARRDHAALVLLLAGIA